MKAICLGSAACQSQDLAKAKALGVSQQNGWTLIAVNQAARDWPGPVDHWCSMHAELLPRWADERARAGRAPAAFYWGAERRTPPLPFTVSTVPNWGGSSGLLAVTVALHLGATRVVLCGVPLDYNQGHYYSAKLWREAGGYRRGWTSHANKMTNVRSMSGWTAGLLGMPTEDWLDGRGKAESAAAGQAVSERQPVAARHQSREPKGAGAKG